MTQMEDRDLINRIIKIVHDNKDLVPVAGTPLIGTLYSWVREIEKLREENKDMESTIKRFREKIKDLNEIQGCDHAGWVRDVIKVEYLRDMLRDVIDS